MKVSRIIFLIFISILLFSLGGCYLSKYEKAEGRSAYPELSLMHEGFGKVLFKTVINFRGYEISGMLLLKENTTGSYRGAIFNEIGMKFMDFELIPADNRSRLIMNVHYIVGMLDRDRVIKTLEKDFNMMLRSAKHAENITVLKDLQMKNNIFRVRAYKGKDCYFVNADGKIIKIVSLSSLSGRKKAEITVSYGPGGQLPSEIHVLHGKMSMKMSLIKN